MYSKKTTKPLTSIPERNEEENISVETKKWVPKKKHEALKAKYKCLKKLFEIYDASVIGLLPDPLENQDEKPKHSKRKKRSHLTKTDACSGNSEHNIGDVTEDENITSDVIKDLANPKTSSQCISNENIPVSICTCQCTKPILMPIIANERRKLTRFQSLIHRIFGIRQDHKCAIPQTNVYASEVVSHRNERRRGLRVKRVRRPKNFRSEGGLRDNGPAILPRVQTVQKSYLNDTTARQCPYKGCNMMLYGIINYNDHINLCHFTNRKYICHYCHEGFQTEYDKYVHENEHLGLNRLNDMTPTTSHNFLKKASVTQTEPIIPDEKIKKIVSFIDKISQNERVINEIKNSRLSESNLQTKLTKTQFSNGSGKKTVSCMNMGKVERAPPSDSEANSISSAAGRSSVRCHLCGESYAYRGQLSLHMDLVHRVYDKYSKFHSCAGIVNLRQTMDMNSQDGRINVESQSHSSKISSTTVTENLSYLDQTLSYDPSTNIIYSSIESLKPKKSFVQKLRAIKYKWEPGTKVIRV